MGRNNIPKHNIPRHKLEIPLYPGPGRYILKRWPDETIEPFSTMTAFEKLMVHSCERAVTPTTKKMTEESKMPLQPKFPYVVKQPPVYFDIVQHSPKELYAAKMLKNVNRELVEWPGDRVILKEKLPTQIGHGLCVFTRDLRRMSSKPKQLGGWSRSARYQAFGNRLNAAEGRYWLTYEPSTKKQVARVKPEVSMMPKVVPRIIHKPWLDVHIDRQHPKIIYHYHAVKAQVQIIHSTDAKVPQIEGSGKDLVEQLVRMHERRYGKK